MDLLCFKTKFKNFLLLVYTFGNKYLQNFGNSCHYERKRSNPVPLMSVKNIQESEFPYGHSPDSEQIEAIGTKFLCRNSVSVEEIQDRHEQSES